MNSVRRQGDLYKDLEKYSNFSVNNNTEKFLDTADQIALIRDSSSIPILMKYFDDESDYGWVFESLSRVLDYFYDEEYVYYFLTNYEIMLPKAREWIKILLYRTINNSKCFQLLKSKINLADASALKSVLMDMDDGSEPHHTQIQEILSLLEK